ncbi:hypothetical protein [Kitasatospora phosalacinea]|uniref:hypothetical protein n=1 Tax=Kitasatospora phosalacinea TaxID=2065 RepID=UPI002557BD74|nr:hypothetical protein [Kitasatospora phosalacinea]
MNNAPSRNEADPAETLFDVEEQPKAMPLCAREGCGKPVPVAPSGRGRPARHCSKACKSKAERARYKARGAVLAGPGDAEPRGGGELPPVPVLEGARAAVADYAVQVSLAVKEFLAQVDEDPAGAFDRFFERRAVLSAQAGEAAAEVRDQARWPHLDAGARALLRAQEELAAPGVLARVENSLLRESTREDLAGEAPRGENPTTGPGLVGGALPTRGGSPTGGEPVDPAEAGKTPRGGNPALVSFSVGDAVAPRAGALALVPSAPGDEIAPRGGNAGAPVAVSDMKKTPRGVIAGPGSADRGGPVTPRGEIRSGRQASPAAAPERLTAPVPQVPYDLALGQRVDQLPPTERAFGVPHRSYELGGGLVHLSWPGAPGVQAIEQYGVVVGWVEVWDIDTVAAPAPWAALVEGRPVVDAADGEVLLAPAPEAALDLLRAALGQRTAPRPDAS